MDPIFGVQFLIKNSNAEISLDFLFIASFSKFSRFCPRPPSPEIDKNRHTLWFLGRFAQAVRLDTLAKNRKLCKISKFWINFSIRIVIKCVQTKYRICSDRFTGSIICALFVNTEMTSMTRVLGRGTPEPPRILPNSWFSRNFTNFGGALSPGSVNIFPKFEKIQKGLCLNFNMSLIRSKTGAWPKSYARWKTRDFREIRFHIPTITGPNWK